ncbi:unnamed protein product [Ixodes hexagonus]
MRITSTKINPIRTRRGNHDALALRMCTPNRFSKLCSMKEATARELLQETLGTPIFETGLVVMPQQPWLCCSPDGLLQVNGETVLTCPIVDRENGVCNVPYLTYREGELSLEPPQMHYTQAQVQLYVLNLQKAIFFVYSPKGSEAILVKRDETFLVETVPKLEHCYFTYLFTMLCK